MSTWSLFDAAGRKVAQFTGREIDAALNIPTGGHMVAGDIDGDTQYFDGATVLARPVLSLPATHSIATNTDWTLPDIPEGTVVMIDGAEAGVVDSSGLTLTFPEAGLWHVELMPPFPWRDAVCEVTAHAD